MSTQNLIMEGLQRVDERASFGVDPFSRPHSGCRPGKGRDSTAAEQRLAPFLLEGSLTSGKPLRRSGLGEFEGLRLLHQLIEKGLVTWRKRRRWRSAAKRARF